MKPILLTCRVIIAPAKKSKIYLEDDGTLTLKKKEVGSDGIGQPQHIHLISTRKIEVGDCFCCEYENCQAVYRREYNKTYNTEDGIYYKIEASTDKSLWLCIPMIDDRFIESYINPNNSISSNVNVELSGYNADAPLMCEGGNAIIYRTIPKQMLKHNYTREEVINLIKKHTKDTNKSCHNIDDDKWISKNLK